MSELSSSDSDDGNGSDREAELSIDEIVAQAVENAKSRYKVAAYTSNDRVKSKSRMSVVATVVTIESIDIIQFILGTYDIKVFHPAEVRFWVLVSVNRTRERKTYEPRV